MSCITDRSESEKYSSMYENSKSNSNKNIKDIVSLSEVTLSKTTQKEESKEPEDDGSI